MFITSLPTIFNFTNIFSPLQFFLLLLIIFIGLYFDAPEPDKQWVDPKEKNIYLMLQACWLGKEALWKSFWSFFILANIAFIYIDYRAINITYTISSWRTVHVMLFFPYIWWIISVWKCSRNTDKKIWASCARTLVIYFIIDYSLRLLLSYEYPHLIFDCRLLILEYGDCLLLE